VRVHVPPPRHEPGPQLRSAAWPTPGGRGGGMRSPAGSWGRAARVRQRRCPPSPHQLLLQQGSRRAAVGACKGCDGHGETMRKRGGEPPGVPPVSWAFTTIRHRLFASALPSGRCGTDRGRQSEPASPGLIGIGRLVQAKAGSAGSGMRPPVYLSGVMLTQRQSKGSEQTVLEAEPKRRYHPLGDPRSMRSPVQFSEAQDQRQPDPNSRRVDQGIPAAR
jgi:hypothetical protein